MKYQRRSSLRSIQAVYAKCFDLGVQLSREVVPEFLGHGNLKSSVGPSPGCKKRRSAKPLFPQLSTTSFWFPSKREGVFSLVFCLFLFFFGGGKGGARSRKAAPAPRRSRESLSQSGTPSEIQYLFPLSLVTSRKGIPSHHVTWNPTPLTGGVLEDHFRFKRTPCQV